MLTDDFELVSLSRTFFPQSSSHGAVWAFIERRWNSQGHLMLSHDRGLWNRQEWTKELRQVSAADVLVGTG